MIDVDKLKDCLTERNVKIHLDMEKPDDGIHLTVTIACRDVPNEEIEIAKNIAATSKNFAYLDQGEYDIQTPNGVVKKATKLRFASW